MGAAAGDGEQGPFPAVTSAGSLDPGRLRTLVGLCLVRLGPRASGAVMGTFLTLLAATRTSSALAITFATTSQRFLSWLVYPLAGRASDQSRTVLGRRAPWMAGGLGLMAVSTWAIPLTHGIWTLALVVFFAKGAQVVYTVTNTAVIPESFGRSRWIKGIVVTYLVGTVAGLSIRATVIARWKTHDPSTWGITFRLAAVYMAVAALAALFLVREAPAARRPRRPPGRIRTQAAEVLKVPNARPLLAALMLGSAAGGAVGRLTPVFYSKILHAGGSRQASAGIVAGVAAAVVGVVGGVVLARFLPRKVVAVGAPLVGSGLAFGQLGVRTLGESLGLGVLGSPLLVAWFVAVLIFLVQLAPRQGGMAERYGVMVLPFSLASMVASYGAAAAVDLAGSYRVMWVFPGVLLVGVAAAMLRLRVPAGYERVDTRRMTAPLARYRRQALAAGGSHGLQALAGGGSRGLQAPLVSGELSDQDVDAAAIFDIVRELFGDPYGRGGATEPPTGPGSPPAP